ncbi:MAG: hypothetical protein ACQERZ_06385 [Fusobacteriota bacterium]
MKILKSRGTILLDFLLVVIVSITILLSILTFFNIKTRRSNAMEYISEKSEYILRLIMNDAKKGIDRGYYESLDKQVKSLLKDSDESLDKIFLQKVKDDIYLETVYSSDKKAKKVVKVEDLDKIFKDKRAIRGDSINAEQKHVYNYITPIYEDEELIGVLNIITSLEETDAVFRKKMIRDMIITIIILIIMISITTYMLLKRIYNPIQKIKEEIQKIKEGDITYQVKINVNNELETIFREIGDLKNSLLDNTIGDRFAHPITGLQGLMHTIEILDEKLEEDSFFGVLSFTIRDLDPYVLEYGFANGENVLRVVSHMFQENLQFDQITDYKLTHVRENQFLLFMDPEETSDFGKRMVQEFDKEMVPLYNNKKGTITFKNKLGEEIDYPMMSLLVIGFTNKIRGEITKFKDLEDKILEIEKLNYDVKEGSQYIEYDDFKKGLGNDQNENNKEKEKTKDEEAEIETDDDLLDGLADVQ